MAEPVSQTGTAGAFKAYGRVTGAGEYGYSEAAQQTIIIALKRSGTWKVYSQTLIGEALHVERIS